MAEFYSARGWEIPPLPWTNLSPPFSRHGVGQRYKKYVEGLGEQALEKAIETANEDPAGWRPTDHVTDTVVDTVCECAHGDPWGDGGLPVPDRFSKHGEPPVVPLAGPVPPGAVDVSGGRVLVRIVGEAGTVTSEVRDPPYPPANKPLVTVSLDAAGKPSVKVEGGSARVRIVER